MAKIMVVNAGSSSLKFKLYEMPLEKELCSGIVERIGHEDAIFTIKNKDFKDKKVLPVLDHSKAVSLVMNGLIEKNIIKNFDELDAVGHRVVQGGEYFSKSEKITPEIKKIIEDLIPLSPNHNLAELNGILAFEKILPNIVGVASFDTAFHQTQDMEDKVFPIAKEYTEKYHIYRYGAHGTSHKYLSNEALKYLDNKKGAKLIICHLGSGASLSAVYNGKCVATSMGLTPTGGIMMGTRTGDIDPSVFYYLCKCTGKSFETIYQEFSKQSGLKGVSNISDDSRDLENAALEGNKDAIFANKLWARRVSDFIGQYFVRLKGCDAIIFSAGIGENSSIFRKLILDNIKDALQIEYDEEINNQTFGGKANVLSTNDSKIKVIVIPTNEEIVIARDTYELL